MKTFKAILFKLFLETGETLGIHTNILFLDQYLANLKYHGKNCTKV